MVTQLNTTRARQGRPGKHILVLLVLSTLLAALVLFGVWASRSKDLASTSARPAPAETATFNTPEPTPRQNETTPPPQR